MQDQLNKTSDIKKYHQEYRKKNKEKIRAYATKRYSAKIKPKSKAKIKKFIEDSLEIKFPYGQYWLIEYSEIKADGLKLKFKTFIFSRSADFAKTILLKKTKEDNPGSKIKISKIAMLHKNFRLQRKKITVSNWLDIRNCSFPNKLNILFKHHDS